MTRYQSAFALDQMSGADDDRPRRRKPSKRERRLARLRREEAALRAARELREDRRRARDREPTLEPVTGAAPRVTDPWGPAVRMGQHIRVQAAVGHRAAVVELRPGLFLVAELPEEATRPEFGFLPLLAPMIVRAASQTIGPMVEHAREAKAARLAQEGGAAPQGGHAPFRLFAARPQAQAPVAAPLALPGPVATSAGPAHNYVQAPNVGWADDALLADVLGCDACGGTCGR